jgi:hypothetical protein
MRGQQVTGPRAARSPTDLPMATRSCALWVAEVDLLWCWPVLRAARLRGFLCGGGVGALRMWWGGRSVRLGAVLEARRDREVDRCGR